MATPDDRSPERQPDSSDRKDEFDQTVDFALQLLVKEAHLVGWTRVEFLTAILDAANNRLSAIEEERELEAERPLGTKEPQDSSAPGRPAIIPQR